MVAVAGLDHNGAASALEFFWPPNTMPFALLCDALNPLAAHPQRHAVRAARLIAQSAPTRFGETLQPLVSRLAADAEATTQCVTIVRLEHGFDNRQRSPTREVSFHAYPWKSPQPMTKLLPMSHDSSVTLS